MKERNDGDAARNARERGEPDQQTQSQDPRERQWGLPEDFKAPSAMSQTPQRDMSGERKDIDIKDITDMNE